MLEFEYVLATGFYSEPSYVFILVFFMVFLSYMQLVSNVV